MKKSLIFVLFALVSVVSYSQVSWNVKVGMNMSNFSSDGYDMKIGFQGGVGMEYQLNDLWSIQPSLLFSTKGAKAESLKMNPMYLDLPVFAAVRFATLENQSVVIKAGPYFACGVGGKIKYEGEKEDFFGDGVKKFDCGLGFGVAYEFSRFFIDLTGEIGLTKIVDSADSAKNRSFSIGVGYKF